MRLADALNLAMIAVAAHMLFVSLLPAIASGKNSRSSNSREERLDRVELLLKSVDLRLEALDLRLKHYVGEDAAPAATIPRHVPRVEPVSTEPTAAAMEAGGAASTLLRALRTSLLDERAEPSSREKAKSASSGSTGSTGSATTTSSSGGSGGSSSSSPEPDVSVQLDGENLRVVEMPAWLRKVVEEMRNGQLGAEAAGGVVGGDGVEAPAAKLIQMAMPGAGLQPTEEAADGVRELLADGAAAAAEDGNEEEEDESPANIIGAVKALKKKHQQLERSRLKSSEHYRRATAVTKDSLSAASGESGGGGGGEAADDKISTTQHMEDVNRFLKEQLKSTSPVQRALAARREKLRDAGAEYVLKEAAKQQQQTPPPPPRRKAAKPTSSDDWEAEWDEEDAKAKVDTPTVASASTSALFKELQKLLAATEEPSNSMKGKGAKKRVKKKKPSKGGAGASSSGDEDSITIEDVD